MTIMTEEKRKETMAVFLGGSVEAITHLMVRLERDINVEQKYISEWGEHNDLCSDRNWELMKEDAQWHLDSWDCAKQARDILMQRERDANK